MKRSLLLLVSALALVVSPAMAKTFYVGGCHAGSFPTISAAVKSVPEASVIDLCPGAYAEQLIISKSLTLQGITSNNGDEVEICCIPGSEVDAESQVLGLDLVPTIWITAGTVNLTNILVNTNLGSAKGCPQLPAGIFYASGTSGRMDHVVVTATAQNCAVGIAAENGTIDDSSITIENSYISSDNFGILMGSQQPQGIIPVLLNTITGNTIIGGMHGMFLLQSRGKVSGNNITTTSGASTSTYDILEAAPATTIMDNTMSGLGTGVVIDGASATVTGNKINAAIGIDLGCSVENVSDNTIFAYNIEGIGLNHVLDSFTGKNTFISTSRTINRIC
jgi:hypothetical protein